MVKYQALLIFVTALASTKSVSSQCKFTFTCLNGGVFNNNSCSCSCFPLYSGKQCEQLDCNLNDPQQCGSYEPRYCVVSLIQNYCAKKCGRCATRVSNCPPLDCKSGVFNAKTCKCDCYTGNEGKHQSNASQI